MHDTFAWILAWVVTVVVPIFFLILIWKLHEIPEKLAENRHHTNVEAVKFLSWVGLFTGGLLFPLAFVYAVMKPVSIQVTSIDEDKRTSQLNPTSLISDLLKEIQKLNTRIAQLEHKPAPEPPKDPNKKS